MPLNFFDLVNISERFMEIINPSSAEKMLEVGKSLRLEPGSRIIDFGCGFGEELALWGEHFGISGVGIEIRPYACERAARKMTERGLDGRIQIACANGAEYAYPAHSFDAAVCLGASFIWNGFPSALRALKDAIQPSGRLAIGEPYWLSDSVPFSYKESQADIRAENELLQMIRQEGFDLENIVRASHDDWDRYECGNWAGLIRWLDENPASSTDRQQVIDHLRAAQDEYLQYGRQYLGWAVYVLAPEYSDKS
jgi:SAM-dependent methyltransferase